ncbi:hypothetical protein ANN_09374 [Periplaneta americana]|uniref:Uncharacterized protein n=1 Tax=Periplaneta americana TaxID=6978 RepID=A0ABQ8TM47_PERAM|nr:hypothetical protein ANN_09374 [Periplaneta americana]
MAGLCEGDNEPPGSLKAITSMNVDIAERNYNAMTALIEKNMPQFDSEGIPNQAPETNKPMILNGPTSRNREGSDQVSVEAKQLGHLYLSIDQETFDPSTGEPYD